MVYRQKLRPTPESEWRQFFSQEEQRSNQWRI